MSDPWPQARVNCLYLKDLRNISRAAPSSTPPSTGRTFYTKLLLRYIEIGRFAKTADGLEDVRDKWFYVLKNLSRIDGRPKALKERVFQRLFKEAEIAQFTPSEIQTYEDSLKA